MIVGIVACSKKKLTVRAPARELYTGRTFRVACKLLRAKGAERLIVLSALHGAVWEDAVLAPYDKPLTGMSAEDRRAWVARTRFALATMGITGGWAVLPGPYAGALASVPGVVRLFPGLPLGKLYSALKGALP